jgi:crossover junction endodeoxyribonuclease RuvC
MDQVATAAGNPSDFEGKVIIGLDPSSYRNCGWAVLKVTNNKLVLLKKFTQTITRDQNDIGRLKDIYDQTQALIDEFKPDGLVVERSMGGGLQFVRNNLSETVGVVKLCCYINNVKVYEVSPAHIKKIIAGHGRAKKPHIKANIVAAFGLTKAGPEHECDAAAFAISHLVDMGWQGYEVKVPYQGV